MTIDNIYKDLKDVDNKVKKLGQLIEYEGKQTRKTCYIVLGVAVCITLFAILLLP